MTFLLDENFPKTAQALLAARGHSVLDLRGTADEGAADADVFAMAQARQAAILSTDRDFFHTIPHMFPGHCGIVVIALRQPNRQRILDRLTWFLNRFGNQSMLAKAYLLRDRTYVVYPAEE